MPFKRFITSIMAAAMALTVLDLVGRPGMMEAVQSAFGG